MTLPSSKVLYEKGYKKIMFLILISVVYFIAIPLSIAQSNCLEIPVQTFFQSKKLILNDTTYTIKNNHQIKIETLKFYLTKVVLIKQNQQVWQEENSYHLIDMEEADSNALCLEVPDDVEFDAIQFNLGIDSLTNVSGAMGGDLDPTNGMYWTWQSGYINFKLQGTSDLCNNARKEFQYHLGGYISPYNNLQTIKLMISNPAQFAIVFNLDQLINELDLEQVNHIMSPNDEAVHHAQFAAKCFSIK